LLFHQLEIKIRHRTIEIQNSNENQISKIKNNENQKRFMAALS